MAEITPFKITIAQSVLERIRKRVADYRWFEAPKGGLTGNSGCRRRP